VKAPGHDDGPRRDTEEKPMIAVNKFALSGAVLLFGLGAAQAGPCNTSKDAGSGNVPGYTGQTTGKASSSEHPPTAAMNKAAGNTATSAQDTQRQMQGQPTAAQQSEREKTMAAKSDKDC
jgi:hypothetical protein